MPTKEGLAKDKEILKILASGHSSTNILLQLSTLTGLKQKIIGQIIYSNEWDRIKILKKIHDELGTYRSKSYYTKMRKFSSKL